MYTKISHLTDVSDMTQQTQAASYDTSLLRKGNYMYASLLDPHNLINTRKRGPYCVSWPWLHPRETGRKPYCMPAN